MEGRQFDVVSIGETMVAFVGHGDTNRFHATPAGAESNVASGIAMLGLRARWVSRLGDDRLGRSIERWVGERGVDVAVVRDPSRPTGTLTKHVGGAGSEVTYFRSESAARMLSPEDLSRAGAARWMHLTGITLALSESAAELVAAAVHRRDHGGRVAFDVNHRPALWPDDATAAAAVLPIARSSDLVLVGDDEAERLFGTSDPDELVGLIVRRDDQELLVKRGPGSASLLTRSGETSQPALATEVVDLVGAGDAFAAGFLAATCFGWDDEARLRLGHVMASRVVGVLDDVPPPFSAEERSALTPEALAVRWSGDGTPPS